VQNRFKAALNVWSIHVLESQLTPKQQGKLENWNSALIAIDAHAFGN
jgi:hypothetical protein